MAAANATKENQSKEPKQSREEEITNIVLKTKKTSYKDLPRISRRISIFDNRENKNIVLLSKGLLPNQAAKDADNNNADEKQSNDENSNNDSKSNDDDSSNAQPQGQENTNWNRISNILLTVAKYCVLMDKTEQNELVYSTLQKTLTVDSGYKRTDQYDQELRELFEGNKIDDCQVLRVINGCNQNVIFGAFYQLLKDYFIPNGFNGMKDVRGDSGWAIDIYFNPKNIVRILHRRQTQYAQPPNEETKHFRVSWELDMSFTPGLLKCNSVFVRVNGIEFHDDADTTFKNQVKTKLNGA
eukprot:CAMPEP_0197057338 /NCGR_PEP_ID=MMETSP1384-20130603/96089_1 /TAXON_ID=29189 /ORGANISM="Ammonia sp." /LENGTH=297 /DNA_ID=CAMNT_0042491727 /DNA_START=22 /DNA_END=911 /DNA_ORIENTATION=-